MLEKIYCLSNQQMQTAEEEIFREGKVTAEELMEQAGKQIANFVQQFFPLPGTLLLAVGKGHNSGDAYAAARFLAKKKWQIAEITAVPIAEQTNLTKKKRQELLQITTIAKKNFHSPLIILDGLLGIGANFSPENNSTIRPNFAKITKKINQLKKQKNAKIIAIDLPTGLDGNTGFVAQDAVKADFTITIASPKIGLLTDKAINNIGRLALAPLPTLQKKNHSLNKKFLENSPPNTYRQTIACPQTIGKILSKQKPNFDTHKRQAGRITIIAGSENYTGAPCLTAEGALRAGGGLVKLFVPKEIYPIIATKAKPEIMVSPFENFNKIPEHQCDTLAIGPGLGELPSPIANRLIDFILENSNKKIILDADALNTIAKQKALVEINEVAKNLLLTPHPGEFKRLWQAQISEKMPEARSKQIQIFLEKFPNINIILKGARSISACKNKPLVFNTTGNPGMATAGIGDVLTGVCSALACKCSLFESAIIGSWLIGRSAELNILTHEPRENFRSLTASKILTKIGSAFNSLENCDF